MSKNKKCPYDEYLKLKNLFLNGNEEKLELVDELLKKGAFLVSELDELERSIMRDGVIQVSSLGNTRTNPHIKAYLQIVSVYQGIIKTLNSILETDVDYEEDEFDEFIKNAIETR